MTNKRNLLLASAMLCVAMGYAQRTPTHPLDIKDTKFDDILANLDSWQPGNQPIGVSRIDDEFYISRVRPLKRITDNAYQANDVRSVSSVSGLRWTIPPLLGRLFPATASRATTSQCGLTLTSTATGQLLGSV